MMARPSLWRLPPVMDKSALYHTKAYTSQLTARSPGAHVTKVSNGAGGNEDEPSELLRVCVLTV